MRLLAESGVGGLGAFRGDCGGVFGVDVSGVFSAKRAASAVRPSTVNLNVVSVSLAFRNNKTRERRLHEAARERRAFQEFGHR